MRRVFNRNADFVKEVGARVKAARLKAGLTQKELAETVQMKRAALINIERGQTSMHISTLKQIADVLQIPPREFL